MKFKDLKIGQKFTRKGWKDLIDIKIKPEKTSSGLIVTHKDIRTNVRFCRVKDDDEVIPVD